MKKGKIFQKLAVLTAVCALLAGLAACSGESKNVSDTSPSDFVAEESDSDYAGVIGTVFDWELGMIMDKSGLYFHLEGDGEWMTLHFADDGIYFASEQINGWYGYTYYGNTIELKKDPGDILPMNSFEVLDLCTLEDDNGNKYVIPDSDGAELVINTFYEFADSDSVSMFFREDGTVNFIDFDGEEMSFSYEVRGRLVLIDMGGEAWEFHIYNRRVLTTDIGEVFLRLYP